MDHQLKELIQEMGGFVLRDIDREVVVTSSKLKEVDNRFLEIVDEKFSFSNDMQLTSRKYLNQTREINFGDVKIGGNQKNCLLIGGPCSVESRKQLFAVAEEVKSLGLSFLRGGCFKPRTSPYSFQGLGKAGLDILIEAREKLGLKIVTEVKDSTHVEEVIASADVIQIGAKAMYDQSILRACSKTQKPVLLKRGFGSTLQEFVQAAEFIISGGNPNVILCERGIRTFENNTRFTLDLCGVAYLKNQTNLPIVLDPSHAMGLAYGVPDLARACYAMGIDGLLVECHPNPFEAKSDAAQQLNISEFVDLYKSLQKFENVVGSKIL